MMSLHILPAAHTPTSTDLANRKISQRSWIRQSHFAAPHQSDEHRVGQGNGFLRQLGTQFGPLTLKRPQPAGESAAASPETVAA